MLFNIGVESPKKDGDAFGIIVPAFESLGYGCFSTADNESELVQNAKDAILSMAEQVSDDGLALSQLDFQFRSFADEYPDFDKWFVLDVSLEHLVSKPKRINIVLPETLISRIDEHVSGNAIYSDRSDFLAKISKEKLTAVKSKSSVGFVKHELTSIVRRAHLEPLAALVCHLYTKGQEEFEVSLYDYLFSNNIDNKRHLDTVVQAIQEEGTTDILKEAYEAIQEEVENHDEDTAPDLFKGKEYTLGTGEVSHGAKIAVGWNKGGTGTTTITNILKAGGFDACEAKGMKYIRSTMYQKSKYRILPLSSLRDLSLLFGSGESPSKQSEFDRLNLLDPACKNIIVINNCPTQVISRIIFELVKMDLKATAILEERQFLALCGDDANQKDLDIALKDKAVRLFLSQINDEMENPLNSLL